MAEKDNVLPKGIGKSRDGIVEGIWQNAKQHPYLFAALLCFCSAALFMGGTEKTLPPVSFSILAVLCTITTLFLLIRARKKQTLQKSTFYLLFIVITAFILFFFTQIQGLSHNIYFLFLLGAFGAVFLIFYLRNTNQLTNGKLVAIVFFLGFTLRLIYILYTTIYTRQHDVGDFQGAGHLSYVGYIYNNFALPEGDVRNIWQHYHPPLHHSLQALWLRILTGFGYSFEVAAEGMQFLNLFYSCAATISFYKILPLFKLNGNALVAAFYIVAFHPTFILLSGSVNNDMLSIAFVLGAILCTIQWYRKPSYGSIAKIALCVGLGMMSKLSVWLVAPAIAVVFLLVLLQNRKKSMPLIKQFALFGVICVPLGLWWSVRNYLSHRVPFTYVPGLTTLDAQYVGGHSAFDRLFNFGAFQFESVYDQFTFYGGKYFEFNPTVGLFKTAMFDEASYIGLDFFSQLLFWSGTIVAVLAFVLMIYVFMQKTTMMDRIMKAFFAILYGVIFISYYFFCFAYPHTCTENIRYAVPLIIIGGLFIGIFLQLCKGKEQKPWQKWVQRFTYAAIGVFSVSSILMYNLIATLA